MSVRVLRPIRRTTMPFLMAAIATVGLLAPLPAAADTGPTCAGRRATIVGTGGNDSLTGTAGNDVIVGFGGHDYIYGLSGSDYICGNGGEDTIDGGSGADRIWGGGGKDSIRPGRGRDYVHGGPGTDRVDLSTLAGGVAVDLARDELITPDGRSTVVAVEDVYGSAYADVLKGDAGRNSLTGGGNRREPDAEDLLVGRGGHDYLSGHVALGGAGDDMLVHGRRLVGHSGDDQFRWWTEASPRQIAAMGGPGDDRFQVTDYCHPSRPCSGDDIRLAGGDGRDRIQVVAPWDAEHDEPYRFDLRVGLVTSGTGLKLFVRDFEEVVGTWHDDTIIGTDDPEYLMGGAGRDTIQGYGGNDILAGGSRAWDNMADTIQGGRGSADVCYTSSPPDGTGPPDVIAGCETTHGVPVLP